MRYLLRWTIRQQPQHNWHCNLHLTIKTPYTELMHNSARKVTFGRSSQRNNIMGTILVQHDTTKEFILTYPSILRIKWPSQNQTRQTSFTAIVKCIYPLFPGNFIWFYPVYGKYAVKSDFRRKAVYIIIIGYAIHKQTMHVLLIAIFFTNLIHR